MGWKERGLQPAEGIRDRREETGILRATFKGGKGLRVWRRSVERFQRDCIKVLAMRDCKVAPRNRQVEMTGLLGNKMER